MVVSVCGGSACVCECVVVSVFGGSACVCECGVEV